MAATPGERSLIGRAGAHAKWARTTDRKAATAPARKGYMARFERLVDPNNELPEGERAIRAQHAMHEHMARAALASVKARAAKRAAAQPRTGRAA